jgi:RimJ/RimL family protein N-acetyltransferase
MLPAALPRLTGTLVSLRPFQYNDAAMVAAASTDPLVPLIATVPADGDPSEVRAFIDRQNRRTAEGIGYSFAIADARTDEGVGQIGLWTSSVILKGRASIGYWIAPGFRRRGYAASALRVLVDWASTLPEIKRLELYVEPWNEGSWRTADACGFLREGLLRSWEQVGDERRDMYMYSYIPTR